MKIDGKVVTYFENCNSPVDKKGYLLKKGQKTTSYQKRWFVLKGNLLFYKDRPAERELIGVIVLEGCTVQLCESQEQYAFSLVWSQPGLRTYQFAAQDQADQESWIKALLSAQHSYVALLVMDLEKKYRDALGALSSEAVGNSFTTPACSSADTCLGAQTAALAPHPAGSGALRSLPAPTTSSKSAAKRSPKLWPKRSANVVPVGAPAPPGDERSGGFSCPPEDFSKLHEDFGKEVKDLIAGWSKRGGGEAAQERDLIDFG